MNDAQHLAEMNNMRSRLTVVEESRDKWKAQVMRDVDHAATTDDLIKKVEKELEDLKRERERILFISARCCASFIGALSDLAQDFLAHFGWPFPGGVRVSLDNSRYTNHSTDPNLVPINGEVRAKRDIEIGEELTENYGNDWKR